MVNFGDYDTLSVTVWLRRAASTTSDRSELLARLRELERDGVIQDLSVNNWSKQIECDPEYRVHGSNEEIRHRLAEFQDWADEEGHELEPAFRWCETTSLATDETKEVVTLPVTCIEVRGDGELLAVFPCTSDGNTNSVADCVTGLEKLAAHADDSVAEQAESTGRPPSGR
ncbi:hypothetical protein EGH21_21160 [Halomicroarcula sp. F13]|uniref:Uncharacterized protein n=1 Tax=Haloarcula rubra TaxID=2487747 RepID=A0AAW4PV30_9EURY|nr:HTH domain-containing protein [Halomicroarcula rubra]MBX0325538.1 hypothetical protein [Halomicroarcula rubra]